MKNYCELCWKLFQKDVEADQFLISEDDRTNWMCDIHMRMWRNSGITMEEWLKDKGLI